MKAAYLEIDHILFYFIQCIFTIFISKCISYNEQIAFSQYLRVPKLISFLVSFNCFFKYLISIIISLILLFLSFLPSSSLPVLNFHFIVLLLSFFISKSSFFCTLHVFSLKSFKCCIKLDTHKYYAITFKSMCFQCLKMSCDLH